MSASLAERIDAALPQTQCTRCGFPDCRAYAQAVADGEAAINRCPPGGAEGVVRLAELTGLPVLPLDPAHGSEGPRRLAVIDEAWCIGCTLCIEACPVDCIVGASKLMHTVVDSQCTGCELCLPVCPVDCISMETLPPSLSTRPQATGWQAWQPAQAQQARERHDFHRQRTQRDRQDNDTGLAARAAEKLADLAAHSRLSGLSGLSGLQDQDALDRKRSVVAAALARARAKSDAAG